MIHWKLFKRIFWISKEHVTDNEYYCKGIYATKNMFYIASIYGNRSHALKHNEKASINCCNAIFNSVYVNELTEISWSNYGINYAFVGSSEKFLPIKKIRYW